MMAYEQVLYARQIAVFVTDLDRVVQDGKGDKVVKALALYESLPSARTAQYPGMPIYIGHKIGDLIPELTSFDSEMAAILAGTLPSLELRWINRAVDDPAVDDRVVDDRVVDDRAVDDRAGDTSSGDDDLEKINGTAQTTHYVDLTIHPRWGQMPITPSSPIIGLTIIVEDTTDGGVQHQQLVQARNELSLLKDRLQRHSHDLAIANAELDLLSKTKSRFVSVAAHELRTPLASITGYVDLLLDGMFGPLNEEQDKFLHVVLGSARRLLDITNNLLDVTMIESGHIELTLTPIDFVDLISRVITEFHPVIQDRQQTIVTHIAAGLTPGMIDETRTTQILFNLIGNASKYTLPGGEITIDLRMADEPGYAQIAIQDTGVGIPEADQARLFSRFFRASSAQLVNASGAGLGLHITQHLIELHGGRIWFESTPGQGSTFYVTLPLWEGEGEGEGEGQ